jgi:DNA-binding NtrC family response regulator
MTHTDLISAAHPVNDATSLQDPSMTIAKKRRLLIVDQDAHFREELNNFLLSAGYECVDSAKNFIEALEKVEKSEYYVVVLDAVSHFAAGLRSADSIMSLKPKTKVILMVGPEVRPTLKPRSGATHQFLIKATFTRDLLYLLEQNTTLSDLRSRE